MALAVVALCGCTKPAPVSETSEASVAAPPDVATVVAAGDRAALISSGEPPLIQKAATAEGFAPAGWKLELQKQGDLNGDGLADLAMILHQADPANIRRDDIDGNDQPLDTNPRILAVALGDKAGGYSLAVDNRTLIPRRELANADDYLEGLEIARGHLRVDLHLFMSAGGWGTSTSKFTFRYQNGRLELIGFDGSDMQRNTGETSDVSVNYLTGRMSTIKGTIEDEKPGKAVWSDLPKKPLLTIDQVGNGIEFQPAG